PVPLPRGREGERFARGGQHGLAMLRWIERLAQVTSERGDLDGVSGGAQDLQRGGEGVGAADSLYRVEERKPQRGETHLRAAFRRREIDVEVLVQKSLDGGQRASALRDESLQVVLPQRGSFRRDVSHVEQRCHEGTRGGRRVTCVRKGGIRLGPRPAP